MMDRLTKTPFFLMLAQPDASPATDELTLAYKEFMCRLMRICLQAKESVPAFFTLNFTRVEFMLLQQERKADSSRQNNPLISTCSKHYCPFQVRWTGCSCTKTITCTMH